MYVCMYCILDRKIVLNSRTTLLGKLLSIFVNSPKCNRAGHLSYVAKVFFKHKWSQAVILFSVFNPAVMAAMFNPAAFASLLMSSFQSHAVVCVPAAAVTSLPGGNGVTYSQ